MDQKEQYKPSGSWPERCIQRAFVDGMKWWQFLHNGSTAFPSEVDMAEQESVRRYGDPLETALDCCKGAAPAHECYVNRGGTKPNPYGKSIKLSAAGFCCNCDAIVDRLDKCPDCGSASIICLARVMNRSAA